MTFDASHLMKYGKDNGWWRTGHAFAYGCRHQLFKGCPLEGRRFLDIGCGDGRWALWAKSQGAAYVVGLEPSAGGSTTGAPLRYSQAIEALGLKDTHLMEYGFEDYEVETPFDVILLNDVVNHFNQDLCELLPEDIKARDFYLETFGKLRSMISSGGHLVVTDCTSKNFWGDEKSPFMRSVRFSVHQPPEVWRDLLVESGFKNARLSWEGWPRIFHLAKLLDNSLVAYFTHSHFKLLMEAD